uniref:Fungal lipase-type domain-containing protein n=1 Tax=Ananas comosus var. bracteatus TaxID=296719 RepID=A0A6V7P975_ANACO|nr:unnamed protein product [Ananas comosus var. bracteatus]
MATATMATAAGAAALLYYTLNRRLQATKIQDEGGRTMAGMRRDRTLLNGWPIGDLAFGINFLLKRQRNFHVASIYAGKDSVPLKGASVISELKYLLNLLTLCWHFSKKPFPLFLEATGYSVEDVLLQEPKAGILKPAFTILTDKSTKCILLLIRGTHSIRDTLTAATGAVVPFHHTVVNEGGISDVVLGYAHYGMVAAARWTAKLATPCLMKALHEYPDYRIQIVGHSLGGGTAALLTCILREQKEFAATTCVAFAPAACMTWELAESGMHFITSVINGADLVPTFSAASVDDLRSEVMASAWLNDLRNQIEQTRILSTVYRSASALGSRLPSIANAKARVAGAGAILRPVSARTQSSECSSGCMDATSTPAIILVMYWPRHRNKPSASNATLEVNSIDTPPSTSDITTEPFLTLTKTTKETAEVITPSGGIEWTSEVERSYSIETSHTAEIEEDEGGIDGEDDLMGHGRSEDSMTEVELWQQLENELYRPRDREQADLVREIAKEANTAAEEIESSSAELLTETKEVHRFYPPGKIMHIVTYAQEEAAIQEGADRDEEDRDSQSDETIGIFLTPRSLYGKLRLSQLMINDHYMPIYRRNIEQLIFELEKSFSKEIPSGDEVEC